MSNPQGSRTNDKDTDMESEQLKPLKEKIWMGVQYYRPPTPLPQDWAGDLAAIKANGLSLLQLRVQWRWHERNKGQYKWDDLDRLFELCTQHGVKVIFKFMLETAPEWLFKKYDCERRDPRGNKHDAGAHAAYYVGGWWPCFDREDVRREASGFIAAAVQRYRSQPQLLAWSIWNEPVRRNSGDCACDESTRKYRLWLKERFTTIENLNDFLGKAWGTFDDIKAPPMHGDYTEMYFWRKATGYLLADQLQWVADIVRKHDAAHPLVTHCGSSRIESDVIRNVCDDELNARTVDWYGMSFWVPTFNHRPKSFARIGMKNDWLAAVSPYYWNYELYANTPLWRKPTLPEDLRMQTLFSLMCGAKGILYWQYRSERFGEESNGYGLMGVDGAQTPRMDAVKAIAETVGKNQDLLHAARPLAQVAIYFDDESDALSRLEETTHDNLCFNFNDTPQNVFARYKQSLWGIYELLWQMNLQVDFVTRRTLGRLKDYPTVILPFPIMVSTDREVQALTQFVEAGGTLISDASPGAREANTWVSTKTPGAGLDALFGCIEKDKLYVHEADEAALAEHIVMNEGGIEIPVARVIAEMVATTGTVLARWSHTQGAALVHHRHGQGQTYLFGTLIGCAFEKGQAEGKHGLMSLMGELLKDSGANQAFRVRQSGSVAMRCLEGADYHICGIFNFSDARQAVSLAGRTLNENSRVESLFGIKPDIVKGGICLDVPRRSVAIFKVSC
jgi:beta-galactosidase